MEEWIELGIGVVVISLHAFSRYNTPATNRCSTTRGRFWLCYIVYALAMVLLYWLTVVFFQSFPQLARDGLTLLMSAQGVPAGTDGPIDEDTLQNLTEPLVIALLYVVVIPRIPVLARFEAKTLQMFWDLGEIPRHSVSLARRLDRAVYHVHPVLVRDIARIASEAGMDPALLGDEKDDSMIARWQCICAMLLNLEKMRDWANPRYARTLVNYRSEIEDIKAEFTAFTARNAALMNGQSPQTDPDGTTAHFNDYLQADSTLLRSKLCRIMARSILGAERNASARVTAIRRLGFEMQYEEQANITLPQLLGLFGALIAVFLLVSALRSLVQGAGVGATMFSAVAFALNYGLSSFTAIYTRSRWSPSHMAGEAGRPYAAYLLSGALAATASVIAAFALKYSRETLTGTTYNNALQQALGELSWSWPFLFQAFAIGFLVAHVADNREQASLFLTRSRDTLWTLLGFGAASLLCYLVMHVGVLDIGPTKDAAYRDADLSGLHWFLLQNLPVALIIGWLVPSWYRRAQLTSPERWIGRVIKSNSDELRIESTTLRPGELQDVILGTAIAMTQADGHVDDSERRVVEACISKLVEFEILDSGVRESMDLFNQRARELCAGQTSDELPHYDFLHPIDGKGDMSEFVIRFALAIGHADGLFDDSEQAILEALDNTLRTDPRQRASRSLPAFATSVKA